MHVVHVWNSIVNIYRCPNMSVKIKWWNPPRDCNSLKASLKPRGPEYGPASGPGSEPLRSWLDSSTGLALGSGRADLWFAPAV